MEWKFIDHLKSEELITKYEEKVDYCFPEDFKECVKQNNGAYPENHVFLSWHGKRKRKRVFNYLYSFNKDDVSTIWHYNDWKGDMSDWYKFSNGEVENYVTFASDPFGNLICFDKRNDSVVWIDHETLNIEFVADSFTEFINSLRKS